MALTHTLIEDYQVAADMLSNFGFDEADIEYVQAELARTKARVSPNHPLNASGQLAYLEGVRALRDVGLRKDFRAYAKGLEGLYCKRRNVIVLFQNVDFAGYTNRIPKAISKKGPLSIRMIERSSSLHLFPEDEDAENENWLAQMKQSNPHVIYFMSSLHEDSEGSITVRSELSMPINLVNDNFSSFAFRILLKPLMPTDYVATPSENQGEDNDVFDIEPEIRFKE